MKVIKYTKRYVVQYTDGSVGWIEDQSFDSAEKAIKYVRKQKKYQPWDYRIVDTEEN